MKKVRVSWETPYPWRGESKPMTEAEALALKKRADRRYREEGWLNIKVEIVDA